jgi:hypothetical protein
MNIISIFNLNSIQRFFFPGFRKAQDLRIINAAIETLKLQTNALEPSLEGHGITDELRSELRRSSELLSQIFGQRFNSSDVKNKAEELNEFILGEKIASKQELPFKKVMTNAEFRKIVLANHLHHKISAEHRTSGLGLSFTADGTGQISSQSGQIELTNTAFSSQFGDHFDAESSKLTDSEFLEDGLCVHSAKKWKNLKAQYKLRIEAGNYVHIDTMSGERKEIGAVGSDYIQILNVSPWGWNPKGGALFGHTWIRMVVDGKLYHLGANLNGQILNPDFMSSLPMSGKRWNSSDWRTMKEGLDQARDKIGTRIIKKLEYLQYYLVNKDFPKGLDSTKIKELTDFYSQFRDLSGGTCSSGALLIFNIATNLGDGSHFARPLLGRVVFNPLVRKVFDCVWFILPTCIGRGVKVLTRGGQPSTLGANLRKTMFRTVRNVAPTTTK